ncbi:MAG: hypothetical protein RIC56_05445 [Pseudomonadales bacterium]
MRYLASGVGLAVWLAAAAGCGGSGDPRDIEDFSPTPLAPSFLSMSGSVQGLEGNVTLNWAGRSQVLSVGSFTIPQAFEAGDSFDLSLSAEPISQRCTIDSQVSFSDQQSDVAGVSISCITQNLVRVSVENFFTGAPMPGIDVTASWTDQGVPQTLSGASDANGLLTFEVPTFDGRIVVNADPDNFGEQSKIVINTALPAGRTARMLMQPVNLDTTFDAADATDLSVAGDVLLSLPANSLVDGTGNAYSGTVFTEFTVVDPSVDVEIMPGDYTSRDPGGATSPIQSYGALSVTFTGSGGEVLDLAPGQVADIHIPVAEAERGAPPASVPLFHYDRDIGYWIEDGTATLATLGSGLQVYSGQVSHFTTWNADEAYTPVFINGCVVNSSGAPFANVRVDATGASYLGSSRAISDADGLFAVPVRALSDVLITVGDGLQSGTQQVTSGSTDSTLPECLVASAGSSTVNLTWGENPRDLDTRLYGFSSASSADDFEVNFTQRSVTVNNITIDLDVDDVTGFGPEVVTLPDFPFPGVYRYAVHLFSGSSSIQASPARVELNLRGVVSVFTPPQGAASRCWAVFDLEVDDSGNVTVTPLGTWEAEEYCTAGAFTSPTGLAPQSVSVQGVALDLPHNPLIESIARKYYRP